MIKFKNITAIALVACMSFSLVACGDAEENKTEIESTEEKEPIVVDDSLKNFYSKYYVDPKDVKLTFPEKKRNLIYLSLESMEKTFESKEAGGFRDKSTIPYLEALKKDSAVVQEANGLQTYLQYGAGTTMSAMVCQTSGLPMSFLTNWMNFYPKAQFLPGAYTIGEVLKDNGYTNTYITGCERNFAGCNIYLEQHGDYEIIDREEAIDRGYIPAGYDEGFGYEDQKVFEILKDEVTKKSKSGKPFNIMASTLDTHAGKEYTCDLCDKSISDVKERVYRCSDNQVKDFIEWLKKQPCFENTTVVITGDHLNMDHDQFSAEADANYSRTVYTCFYNPAVEKKIYTRKYNAMDMYPTTLAAMGVKIEGERMALGTNLFSDEQNLIAIVGKSELSDAMEADIEYYNEHFVGGEYWEVLGSCGEPEEDPIVVIRKNKEK